MGIHVGGAKYFTNIRNVAATWLATQTFKDTLLLIVDDGDVTKKIAFQASGITTDTTRTFTVPDVSDTLVTLGATQTLTAKTLDAINIDGGTIDGITSLTVDADLDFTGPQEITTSSDDLTLNPAQNTILEKAAVLKHSSLTISSGVITVTSNYHTIISQGGSSTADDLDTISGAQIGQFLILVPRYSAADITLKNGSGNIYTRDGADVIMTSTSTPVMLVFDNGSSWRVVAGQAGL
jgi:hypothetical protein